MRLIELNDPGQTIRPPQASRACASAALSDDYQVNCCGIAACKRTVLVTTELALQVVTQALKA